MKSLAEVRKQRSAILELANQFGARNVRIFGSVARGEEKPSSDLDVLVDFDPGRSLLDLSGFRLGLEDLLGFPVDVVVEGGISRYIEPDIMQDAVPL